MTVFLIQMNANSKLKIVNEENRSVWRIQDYAVSMKYFFENENSENSRNSDAKIDNGNDNLTNTSLIFKRVLGRVFMTKMTTNKKDTLIKYKKVSYFL